MTMDKNLDWKLLCFNITETTNAAFFWVARHKRRIPSEMRTINAAFPKKDKERLVGRHWQYMGCRDIFSDLSLLLFR